MLHPFRRVRGAACKRDTCHDCNCAFCDAASSSNSGVENNAMFGEEVRYGNGSAMEGSSKKAGRGQGKDSVSSSGLKGIDIGNKGSRGPPSLVSLCVAFLGQHLEGIIEDVHLFAPAFPSPIRQALAGIARRRGLMCDVLLRALIDDSWRILDVSDSAVTDEGICHVADRCSQLEAIDLSGCDKISVTAIQRLVETNPGLHTIRVGGTPESDAVFRLSLRKIVPGLSTVGMQREEESWEDVDMKNVGKGAQALRWLVWETIDEKSFKTLQTKCPKIKVNPKPFSFAVQTPREALIDVELDAPFVADIDEGAWSDRRDLNSCKGNSEFEDRTMVSGDIFEPSLAERFKLAYQSREERLAPKRAKNLRQKLRREERAWLKDDVEARSRFLASSVARMKKLGY